MTQLICGVSPVWLFTVPLPPPGVPLEIVIVKGPFRNRAEIVRAVFMVTLQVPVPEHGLDQPTNEWPLTGTAVSVTAVPWLNKALQVPDFAPATMLQLMPAGLDVTFPLPVPRPEIVSR